MRAACGPFRHIKREKVVVTVVYMTNGESAVYLITSVTPFWIYHAGSACSFCVVWWVGLSLYGRMMGCVLSRVGSIGAQIPHLCV